MHIESVPGFRKLFSGTVLLPGENGYDENRAIWNGMFDNKPGIRRMCSG